MHEHLVLLLVLHGLVVALVDLVVAGDSLVQGLVVGVGRRGLLGVPLQDQVVLQRTLEGLADEVVEGLELRRLHYALLYLLDLLVLQQQLEAFFGLFFVLEEV